MRAALEVDGSVTTEGLHPGPGLLNWDDVEAYDSESTPRTLGCDGLSRTLQRQRAFELLWVPPSMRYYDAGSVYESPEAVRVHEAADLLGLDGRPQGRSPRW